MSSVTPQPEAAGESYKPMVFGPDLTQVGVEVGWEASQASESPNVEFKAGPPVVPIQRWLSCHVRMRAVWQPSLPTRASRFLMTSDYTCSAPRAARQAATTSMNSPKAH